MMKLSTAALLFSVLAFGVVALAAAPTPTAGLFTDPKANGGNAFTTATLQPPTGVGAVAISPTEINVTWTASISGYAAGYNVYRSLVSGGPYALIAWVPGVASIMYPDSGLSTGTTYYYVVQTGYQNWTSAYSNQASATTP